MAIINGGAAFIGANIVSWVRRMVATFDPTIIIYGKSYIHTLVDESSNITTLAMVTSCITTRNNTASAVVITLDLNSKI